jgi:serine/threonine protein kinase
MLKNNGEELILIDLDAGRPITQSALDKKPLTVIATDGYISPEQRRGRTVTQSDFYALGITFVHLLTGKHPNEFEEDRNKRLCWRSSAPQISQTLVDFIDKLMARSLEDRPKNAKEILQKLEEIERTLEYQERVNKWLSLYFKKIAGLIVFVLLGIVFWLGIVHSNKPEPLLLPKNNPQPAQPR